MSDNNRDFKQEEKTIFLGGLIIVVLLLVIFAINGMPGYLYLIVGLLGITLGIFYIRSQEKENRFEWIKEYIYARERERKKESLKYQNKDNNDFLDEDDTQQMDE
ncbi:MAG: hypothetical protein K9W44_08440 [Candidatus Lokiarchaeota archaeon]|nr:hypothetical protein [Candidatus Harpocratesius repetitus]